MKRPVLVDPCRRCSRTGLARAGRGLCGMCHDAAKADGTLTDYPVLKPRRRSASPTRNPMTTPCLRCNEAGLPSGGRGLCQRCHRQAGLDGTLIDYPRASRSSEDMITTVRDLLLRTSPDQIPAILNVTPGAIAAAFRRADLPEQARPFYGIDRQMRKTA